MSEIRLKGENKELIDEIIKLSKEYGIMTPYTSFLILEKETDYNRWGIRPLMSRETKDAGMKYAESMKMTAGENAVSSAKDIIKLKERVTVGSPTLDTVKHVGDKTFYLKDNIWIDSKYKEGMKIREIKYLSEEYLDMFRRRPEIGKYFAIAKDMIVIFEGECYRVTE